MPAEAAVDLWRAILAAGVGAGGAGRPGHPAAGGRPAAARPRARARASRRCRPGWAGSCRGPSRRSGARTHSRPSGSGACTGCLRGISTEGRRPPRAECAVRVAGAAVGETTSGNFSPVLGHGIALAFLPPTVEEGTAVEVDLRGSAAGRLRGDHPVRPQGVTVAGAGSDRLERLEAGQPVVFGGDRITWVSEDLAREFAPGDRLVVVQDTGALLRIPAADHALADAAVTAAHQAFLELGRRPGRGGHGVLRGLRPPVGGPGRVRPHRGRQRRRRQRRPGAGPRARRGWCSRTGCGPTWWPACGPGATCRRSATSSSTGSSTRAGGSSRRRAPLGVVGFVFEGRPNVFADATGVLRGGNTVVFRIGSRRAGHRPRHRHEHALVPALAEARAAGGRGGARSTRRARRRAGRCSPTRAWRWRWRGARARRSPQLGAVARQAGVPVSLHGTGGAWLVAGVGRRRRSLRRRGLPLARPQGLQHAQRLLHRHGPRRTSSSRCFLAAAGGRGRAAGGAHQAARGRGRPSGYVDPGWFARDGQRAARAEGPCDEPQAEPLPTADLGPRVGVGGDARR